MTRIPFFAYGIFRRGPDCDTDWEYVGPKTVEHYSIFQSGPNDIAFARPRTGGRINGDLYMVPERDMLLRIDRIEGHPDWYRREEVTTTTGETVHMYVQRECVEDNPRFFDNGPDWSGWRVRQGYVAER
jgi:gamma-glutamylcyclotransferase (GGCT)/AIG2-like uncharacterized protein YtfP